MTAATPPHSPKRAHTIVGMLTVIGDMIMISLGLLVLLLGVVTAAPAAAAAIDARAQVSTSGPSTPITTLFRGTGAHFRTLWAVGPIAIIVGIFGWISTAFWLVAPAPLSVIMIAAVLFIIVAFAMILFALPSAATAGISRRETLVRAVQLAVRRPFVSVLALAAAVAAVILAVYLPTVGIVAIGGALVEISWRAWGRPARQSVGW
ncbi:hypothetical protein [Microbacterium sp. R86528]|uniref:hypothetical protein n=1 Tax=Microbacterium sp. R86528 TaxID=3093864 RepID=UPI0037C6BE40